jgi:hypothetical protein
MIIPPGTIVRAQAKIGAAQVPATYRTPYDFTGDGKSDFANVSIGAAGTPIVWNIMRNPAPAGPGAAFIRSVQFGVSGDSMTAGDYLGDGKTEISIFRPSTAIFYHLPFPESGGTTAFTAVPWGVSGGAENTGRVGDYDCDGKDDEVNVRMVSNQLTWHIHVSAGTNRSVPFGRAQVGFSTLAFQGADFNGDGRDELVMCNANTTTGANTWWIGDSITGAVIKGGFQWGNFVTDYFVSPDDYTGDGIADVVVYRAGGAGPDAGAWLIMNGATNALVTPVVIFGVPDPAFTSEDIPLRGNFDGDNRADIAVFRRSTKTYYWLKSSDGILGAQQWGNPADANELPIAAFFSF